MVPLKCRFAWVTTRSAWLVFVENWCIAYVRHFVSFWISMNFCRHVLNSSSLVPLRCQYAWVTTGSAWLVFVVKSFWGILFTKSFKSKGYGARSTTTSLRGVPRHSRLYFFLFKFCFRPYWTVHDFFFLFILHDQFNSFHFLIFIVIIFLSKKDGLRWDQAATSLRNGVLNFDFLLVFWGSKYQIQDLYLLKIENCEKNCQEIKSDRCVV